MSRTAYRRRSLEDDVPIRSCRSPSGLGRFSQIGAMAIASNSSAQPVVDAATRSQLREMGFSAIDICEAAERLGERPRQFDTLLQELLGAGSEVAADVASSHQREDPKTKLMAELIEMGFGSALINKTLARLGPRAGVAEVMEALCTETGTALEACEDAWECPICFADECEESWRCPQGHRFCISCMHQHVDAVAFPRCPDVGCSYELKEPDLRLLDMSPERLAAFASGQLQCAVEALSAGCNGSGREVLVRCQRAECSNVVLMVLGTKPTRFLCSCGAEAFCTHCHQAPYHFHASCAQVQPLRERWFAWISAGRERYHGREQAARVHEGQLRALRDGIKRHIELEQDEHWKEQHCRCCPNCQRPVQKLEGCDSMKCGQDAHGGNLQDGCGHSFRWSDAKRYAACVSKKDRPKASKIRSMTERQAQSAKLRGANSFHPFTHCSNCSLAGQGIKGLRFRCIHCENYNLCSSCEPQVGEFHDQAHVFEILFESVCFDWSSILLPSGTHVRVVRRGTQLPPKSAGRAIEGLTAVIQDVIKPREGSVFFSKVHYRLQARHTKGMSGQFVVPVTHVEPLLTSREQAVSLIDEASKPQKA